MQKTACGCLGIVWVISGLTDPTPLDGFLCFLCEVDQYQIELVMLSITRISSVLISVVRMKEKWPRKKTKHQLWSKRKLCQNVGSVLFRWGTEDEAKMLLWTSWNSSKVNSPKSTSFFFSLQGLRLMMHPNLFKAQQRLLEWKAKMLSSAGGLELINSTLSSMQFYWTAMFLPKSRVNLSDKLK